MKKILDLELEKIKLSKEGEEYLLENAQKVIDKINSKLARKGIDADVFIGGSLAKNTLIRKKNYDIDVFLRFNKQYGEDEINKLTKKIFWFFSMPWSNMRVKRLHGSRDYYQVYLKKNGISVEVIPVLRISKPENARNLTDLSYFHVSYIKKQISKNPKLSDEIKLAKSFAHGCNCYGAESYIQGFSGYSIELLICHYKSFKKFISEMAKAKEQIIIDIEKHYKNKEDIINSLNPSKLHSPIVIIDPTFKERNAVKALSKETFDRFRKSANKFLENPSEEFFTPKKINLAEMMLKAKDEKGIFAVFEFSTSKQPGDIAGTKLLKFSKYLEREIKNHYDVVESEFDYPGMKKARLYTVLKRKKEIVFHGPHISREDAVKKFKEKHPIWYIEDHIIKSARSTDIPIKKFMKEFNKQHKKTVNQMSVKRVRLI